MPIKNGAITALDTLIRKSRVHLYKPIQIAEILYRHRVKGGLDLLDLESYRNISKRWRDEVSTLLVGRCSASSQKFQDNLFESNAITSTTLNELGKINKKSGGAVEAHIYRALEERLSSVKMVENYITSADADSFSLKKLVGFFKEIPGLKRSIDKMYEILVYALFATIVRSLKAQITLEILNKDAAILADFQRFIKMILGVDSKQTRLVLPTALYRAGVANASDKGLDIWTNFGLAIQVKHLTLTAKIMEDVVDDISADKIVIVCLDKEKKTIELLLKQVGWSQRIQGVITIKDLDDWYKLCLEIKYRDNLGAKLFADIKREFDMEFPSNKEVIPFMDGRGYNKIKPLDNF